MLRALVILFSLFLWMVTQSWVYAGAVLVVGWIAASILEKVLTCFFYLLAAAIVLMLVYGYITDQSFIKVLWQLL